MVDAFQKQFVKQNGPKTQKPTAWMGLDIAFLTNVFARVLRSNGNRGSPLFRGSALQATGFCRFNLVFEGSGE
jgi:hypothetical protein